jgi:hypothetical protein
MARGPVKLSKIHLKRQAAWGTAETSFVDADLLEVTGEFIPPANQEALQPDVNKGSFEESTITAGSKAAFDVTFSFVPHALPTGFASGNPTATIEHRLFEDALGTLQSTGYIATRAAGVSTTKLFYTDGQGSANWTGQGLLVPKAGGNIWAWPRELDLTTDPDEALLITALPVAPTASAVQYGSVTCALTNDGLEALPFTMQFAGQSANTGWRCWDGRVSSLTVEVNAKAQPTINVTMRFLNWVPVDALTVAPYTFPRSQFGPAIQADSYGDLAAICPASWSLSITQELAEVPCIGADQGASRLTTSNRMAEITLRHVVADANNEAWYPPGFASGPLVLAATTTPGRALSVLVPAPVVAASEQLQSIEGLWGAELNLKAYPYSGDAVAAGSAVENTGLRIAFG